MSESTVFLKYLVFPSGFLKDLFKGFGELLHPKRLSIIFIVIAILSVIISSKGRIIAGVFLLLALLIQFRMLYKAGDHNRWKKEKLLEESIIKKEIKEEEDGTRNTGITE